MKIKTRQRGFTLVELIIVVAVIGILTVLAVPMIAGQREAAQQASKVSNGKTIGRMLELAVASDDLPFVNGFQSVDAIKLKDGSLFVDKYFGGRTPEYVMANGQRNVYQVIVQANYPIWVTTTEEPTINLSP